MYQVKRILVGLDLSEIDQTLIRYTSFLASSQGIEKVYFLHVAKSLNVSENLAKKYPDIVTPQDEALEEEIRKTIDENYNSTCPFEVEIREGNAEEKILRWAEFKKIDLAIMGRKLELKGEGVLPNRLARTIHCSILFLPENAKPQVKRILVPVDFSDASFMAFEEALALKKAIGADIILENTYEVPAGYHFSGKSFEEFAEIMKSNAYEDAVDFISKANVKSTEIVFALTLDKDDNPAKRAYETALQHQVDLIIIGSKGRTGMASILLGSVAEKMIHCDLDIPLLIVKDKNENLSFLQALLRI